MISNGADLWERLCQETVGCDSNGDTVANVTAFGTVAISHGLSITSYQVGRKQPAENLHGEWEANRKAVVQYLRDWADAIEAGR